MSPSRPGAQLGLGPHPHSPGSPLPFRALLQVRPVLGRAWVQPPPPPGVDSSTLSASLHLEAYSLAPAQPAPAQPCGPLKLPPTQPAPTQP